MYLLGRLLLLTFLLLPSVILIAENGNGVGLFAAADEDEMIGENDDDSEADVTVEADEPRGTDGEEMAVTETDKEEEEEEEKPLKPSPDAETKLLFTKPSGAADFPAGKMIRLLVGFANRGEQDFIVESMDAAFRYPQDYTFYIQNFSAVYYSRPVEPARQATFEYSFTPSESYAGRPFGLTINLNYKDTEGNIFQDAVFNQTINILETDEGLDGETFFLYVFLVAMVILLVIGLHQLFNTYGKKRLMPKSRPVVETGTQNRSDVDYSWLPETTLQELKRSSKAATANNKASPRQRTTKRSAGNGDE